MEDRPLRYTALEGSSLEQPLPLDTKKNDYLQKEMSALGSPPSDEKDAWIACGCDIEKRFTWDLQQQALVKMADETECDFGNTKSNKGKQSKMEMKQETASIAHDHHYLREGNVSTMKPTLR